jgi:hypothetical protein
MKHNDFFRKHPVFTGEELATHLSSHGEVGARGSPGLPSNDRTGRSGAARVVCRDPGRSGNLEVDINFMFRVPLWPVTLLDSYPVGAWRATGIPVLDHHELAAGKLAALLSRRQARDLFDSHRILRMDNLDSHRLRIGFVVYGAMSRKDWRTVSTNDVDFDAADVARQLTPTLLVNATEV